MLANIGSEILQAVQDLRQDLVDLTCDIIPIESVIGSEGRIQEYLAGRARLAGLAVDVFEPDLAALANHPAYRPLEGLSFEDRPNVVAVAKGTGGGRSLLLNGHVDTIPVEPRNAWEFGPFSALIRGGRI
jgi:acetylornithine deacetylase